MEAGLSWFFTATSLYIPLRVLVLGSRPAASPAELVVSLVPELLALALAVVLGVVVAARIRTGRVEWRTFDGLVLAYAVSNLLLGTLLSRDLVLALYGFRLTYLPMMLYFVARLGLRGTAEPLVDRVVWWYTWLAILSVTLYFFSPELTEWLTIRSGGRESWYHIRRLGSVFLTPVVAGTVMGTCCLFCFARMMAGDGRWRVAQFIVFWITLSLTASRGPILSFLVVQAILAWFRGAGRVYARAVVFMALAWLVVLPQTHLGVEGLVAASVQALPASPRRSVAEGAPAVRAVAPPQPVPHAAMSPTPKSRHRIVIEEGIRDFLRHPAGYGLGKSGHVAHRFLAAGSPGASTVSTDGWYVKLATETGIWGIASYAFIWMLHALQAFRIERRRRASRGMFHTFLFGVFLAVALQNVVSNVLDFLVFSYLYWFLIGCARNELEHSS